MGIFTDGDVMNPPNASTRRSMKERMDFPDIVVEIWHRGDRGDDLGATTAAGDVFLARCVVPFADAEASSRVGNPGGTKTVGRMPKGVPWPPSRMRNVPFS